MRILPAAAALLVLTSLTSCSDTLAGTTGPDPGPVAERLADGLESGDLHGVPFPAGGTPSDRDLETVVEGMDGTSRTVTVADVHEGEGTATASLGWSWPVAGQHWTYTSEAELTLADDRWQVRWQPAVVHPALREGARLELGTLAPERGRILGAGGQPIVTDRPVTRFGIDKSAVPAARAVGSARALAALLDIDAASYAGRVRSAGDAAFVEAIVYRREEVPVAVGARYQDIRGALAIRDTLPLAPTREFAAPILGTVGEPTAEMVEEDPDRYAVGQQVGLSGLQLRYDEQLVGTPGAVVTAVASDGRETELFREETVPGEPLRLTLEPRLQLAAERLLAPVGPASALVAVRPSTGHILAAANGPGTDGYNAATYGQYPPGSTFKTVSTLALLRSGLGADSPVPCTDSIVVDGRRFGNYDDYPPAALGRVPLRTALANSCNTAFISQADRLAGDDLANAAASLGMGVDHDAGFPSFFGSVEPARSETGAAADMIGQGTVLASPMAMATVIASVQAGETVLPVLVKGWDVDRADVPALEAAEAGQLRRLLRGVVTSGSGSLLADVPGPPVIAKTGTAEYVAGGGLATHAWMIAAQGDLAVAVFVGTGESGSGTAGPLLEAFLRTAATP